MAMGLSFLGRGGQWRLARIRITLVHIVGSVAGGAAVGGLVGALGSLLQLSSWRPWIIGAAILWALGLTMRRGIMRLGSRHQVPRSWSQTMPPARRFVLWGVLLGSGVATPIVSSSFLVLVSAELTAGVLLGAAAGAIFGAMRELTVLYPLLRRLDQMQTMGLLSSLRVSVRRLSTVLVIVGGVLMVLVSWP